MSDSQLHLVELKCSECNQHKHKDRFSKTQIKKGVGRRCQDCVLLLTNKKANDKKESSHWRKIKSLVYGFIHEIQINVSTKYIPLDINNLVLSFYGRDVMLYAIGKNGNGEFGVNHKNAVKSFTFLKDLSKLCTDINDIHVGWQRFYIKNAFVGNEMYCCGQNNFGQCGMVKITAKSAENVINYDTPITLNIDDNDYIKIMSSGMNAEHTIIVTACNKFFAFGRNKHGQFGNDKQSDSQQHTPLLIESLNNIFDVFSNQIKLIACSWKYSLFLTHSGNVYSSGNNSYGQCGSDDINNNILKPRLISFPSNSKIINICCGDSHNLCITNEHKLMVFGKNNHHQLGIDNTPNDPEYRSSPIIHPYFVKNSAFIIDIGAGMDHSCVIDLNGNCWYFGKNRHGQIGNGVNTSTSVTIPFRLNDSQTFKPIIQDKTSLKSKPEIDVKIIKARCGGEHSIILTDKNNVYTFGSNESSECCDKKFISSHRICSPRLLTYEEIGITDKHCYAENVIAGYSSTIIVFGSI